MSKELGNKLHQLRTSMDFTQQQIADQIRVDRSTYSNYERAVTEPDVKTIILLAKIFGVDPNELLAGSEDFSKVAEPASIPVYSLSKDEKSIIIRYRLLDKKQQKAISEYIDGYLSDNK
ncbi:MAG: helix-turn-helix transcriptional regulator [Ruminococcus sp.]|nr:helix-turn-helix transcriptional regulator [Ruminococcus sp.]